MFNVLSCFDGMSCGQIALERANINVDNYYASEIDKYAISVTQHRYPNTIQIGDVANIKGTNLPKIDLIIGGSPCQGFSLAGKQLNFDDIRSKLFFEFTRLIEECNPTYFLLENVKMNKIYENIITDNYMKVSPIEINSNLLSAQNRKRLYWTNISGIKQPKDKKIHINDIKEKNTDKKYNLSEKAQVMIDKYSKNYKLCGKSPTLTTELAHSIGKNITPKLIKEIGENRRATPRECERLQTVPDDYTLVPYNKRMMSDTQRYKMLGNGWTVDVISHIFKNIGNKPLRKIKQSIDIFFT
jgi:DNA-cytosine methyltransferase